MYDVGTIHLKYNFMTKSIRKKVRTNSSKEICKKVCKKGSEELGKSMEYRADVGVSGRYAETLWGEPSNAKFVSKFLS